MNLEKLSSRVAKELATALPDSIPADERQAIVEIVRQAMQDSAKRTTRELKSVAVVHCGPESDLVHKLQEGMDKKRDLLISNLNAMR